MIAHATPTAADLSALAAALAAPPAPLLTADNLAGLRAAIHRAACPVTAADIVRLRAAIHRAACPVTAADIGTLAAMFDD